MKKNTSRLKLLAIAAAIFAVPASGFAATANTSLTVDATVIASLTVTQTTALNFGTFALTDPGSVGTRTTTGGDTNIYQVGAPTSGLVTINGPANQLVNVSVSAATLSDTGGNGGADMTATLTVPSATVTLDGSGSGTSAVNGSLAVGINQTPSTYSGTATVTVDY